ncbi:dipeptidyl-peptidase-4 [Actinopolymorpha cephalotaxi]|uniref:Dipeptidyl-peptidase-4 n=1 Tax=Actinopolymorpha cephalotaxi TaxID=504797 RepID=A0A1I2YVX3_9ACTN|nr:prolyl oligopeptidase family serine peptidase [Actinopolymorpha cephalotaxi]NYH81727.1 dipeptidyl-peptidase-4 [Actinopolymorpha cephalotaxi]SFH29813.1 dipeptidyl-peptidase-4 [Actinopolymorpha cephalotaxi]
MTTPQPRPAESAGATSAPTYPRLNARTLRFTLGAPRTFSIAPDGSRIVFLRAPSGTDRGIELWSYDVDSGTEHRVADPATLLTDGREDLSPAERARRERSREGAAGIVGYACDRDVRHAAFALSSRLWLADLDSGQVRELPSVAPVVDPRPDPTGRYVAYASNAGLRLVDTQASPGSGDGTPEERVLVGPEPGETTVSWGVAEFVAAEEMDRVRGYWWAPDGTSLLVERYDEAPVPQWHIANPAQPDQPPVPVRYPAAGTGNADVSLWLVDLAGERREVRWDSAAYPYLVDVSWTSYGPPLLRVLSRDQKSARVLTVDLASGATAAIREDSDPAWVEIVSGTPRWLPDGRLLTTVDTGQTRQLAFDGEPVTPVGLQVGAVLDVDDDGVLVSATTEPTEQHVLRVGLDGTVTPLTREPGVHLGRASGGTVLLVSQSLDHDGSVVRVLRGGAEAGRIESRQEKPPFTPDVTLLRLGPRELRTAVLFPRDHTPGSRRLPLLLDPYGGPHALRVRSARAAFLASQWLADQGFCVVVADGRGTPNRGPAWEREVLNDFGSTLDDQVEVVQEIARRYPDDVDPGRVAMRGWSYGGYLSALAVIARPDVFHAGVAGAPVTDWRLYDTCYTERYLGHPDEQPDVYARNSLLDAAAGLERPLLLIHGLADDNVVAAHTLRLSSALLAAGRRHTVLPLTGVTHMTPQEVVAENLLLLELDFLREALG